MTRHVKRGGKVWINIFPDKPVTAKPAETRMGSGKGNPERWVAVVKPGRVMFELGGVDPELAHGALNRAIPEASDQSASSESRGGDLMAAAAELRELADDQLLDQLGESKQELSTCVSK